MEVKELKAKGGRIRSGEQQFKTIGMVISRNIEEHKAAFGGMVARRQAIQARSRLETKRSKHFKRQPYGHRQQLHQLSAVAAGYGTNGTNKVPRYLPTFQSDGDFINYPRANSPVGEGSFGRQATEGATKAQVDRDYTMVH
jgi:hypothetical protein